MFSNFTRKLTAAFTVAVLGMAMTANAATVRDIIAANSSGSNSVVILEDDHFESGIDGDTGK